jgi:putative ABC transport system substrate-binding protein
MRKLFYLATIVFSIVLLSACNKKNDDQNQEEEISISIIRSVTVDAFDKLEKGIMDSLEGLKINFSSYSAEADPSKFENVVRSAILQKPDYIVIIGALLTDIALSPQYKKSLPCIISTAIDEPEVVESLKTIGVEPKRKIPLAIVSGMPEKNNYKDMADFAKKISPQSQKAGIIYNLADISSSITAEKSIEQLKQNELDVIPITIDKPDDVIKAVRALLLQDIDFLVLPHDKYAIRQSAAIAAECHEQGVFTLSLDNMSVTKGGLAFGVGIDYYDLGVLTAQTIREIINGQKASELEVKHLKEANVYYNPEAIQKLNLDLSTEILEKAISK